MTEFSKRVVTLNLFQGLVEHWQPALYEMLKQVQHDVPFHSVIGNQP